MLELRGLEVYYGVIHALHEMSLRVNEGEIVTLIGANGAGKSTALLTISGLLRPRSGHVLFQGDDLTRVLPHEIVRRGVVQVPEGRRIFPEMTIVENLELGAYTRSDRAGIAADLQRVFAMFPILEQRRRQKAGTMSGGEQQMLAIARGLMARPKLLLMDEPSLGLAPLLVKQIFNTITEIRQQGVTVLLVEQNARMALTIADRGYVLETGQIVQTGAAADLLNDPGVQTAYLGGA